MNQNFIRTEIEERSCSKHVVLCVEELEDDDEVEEEAVCELNEKEQKEKKKRMNVMLVLEQLLEGHAPALRGVGLEQGPRVRPAQGYAVSI